MIWSLNVGRIAGTAIRVHITLVPFLGVDRDLKLGFRRGQRGLALGRIHSTAVRLRGGA